LHAAAGGAQPYEAGLDWPAAARFLLKAAESAQVDGAAGHAANLSRRALALLDEAARGPRPPDTDALRAELVAVLIGAQWENARAADPEIAALIAQGRAAADRCGDAGLRARLLHAEARHVLGTQDVRAAIDALGQARELARAAGDAVSELAIAIDLGNTIDIQSLERGLAVLREALALYESTLASTEAESPELIRLHARLVAFIGIGEFDRGNLGEARRLLDRSLARLDALGRSEDLPRILNYRAQVALASGEFDAAEADVRRALERGGDGAGPWASLNRAFLGKVFLESGRPNAAGEEIRAAWNAVEQAWQVRLGTVVRQYLVEFLLRPGSSDAELDEAAGLLEAQITDAEASGFTNMLVTGHSLAAERDLRRDRPAEALDRSSRAVEILEAACDLPIVRTEEVLWRHARCLQAAGEPGADAYFGKARAVVERKATSLEDDAAKERLLTMTPVARVLAANS
jgi:tetratricopeptide (TPR) repeat protein